MALPAVVQKAAEEADALQQQLYSESTEPASAEPPVVAESPAEPPSNVIELPQAEPAKPVETPKAKQDDAAYWKQRFDTVQGVLSVETSKLRSQLEEQNQQMQQLLAQLQEKQTTAEPEQSLVTDKDSEDFGADLVDMARRVTRDEINKSVSKLVQQEIARLREEFGAVQQQVGHVAERVGQSEADKFWSKVKTMVPDWDVVDADPSWIQWLDSTPEWAEDTYRELASKAISKGDAAKVAKLVDLWRGPMQAPAPAPTAAPAVNPELQRQVQPSSSKASSSPMPAGKIWSKGDYEAAYDVRNVRRFGQAEADRLIAEADLAVAEGRVRW